MRAGFDSLLSLVIFLVFTGFAVAALVFAAMAREDAYRAADKQTKKFWLIILGINLALNLLLPMLFLQIAGLVAAIVFMVDVRPALAQVSGGGRGGRRGGGSSSDGPYGPYNGGR
ncbi:membrane protein [Streptomyces tanashiensis]|nr:membrane protein [Streptomyces tanashiensis]GGY57843.1 membrane protein [Streptomyces tanashiensis]